MAALHQLRQAAVLGMVGLLAAAGVGGCAGGTPPRTVSLRMHGQPETATVTVDEQWIGNLARVTRYGVALPPGRHRITVEAPGHFPWDRLVDVKEGDPPVQLDVALVAIPD
ncbi:PEGA domain-containing protein [Pendulispora albinea]|uniref:PEGA domain-containing protein n=1 Tax=Pendulispora albinea TaxID=2741071 RepID=A0ABZ2MAD3_9BACT